VGSAEGPIVVGVMVAVMKVHTESIAVEEVAACGGGQVLGLLVGRMVGLDVGFVAKLRLQEGTRDGTLIAVVGIAEGAA